MRFNRHSLSRAKAFLIELTAFVSLVLVLITILVIETRQLLHYLHGGQ